MPDARRPRGFVQVPHALLRSGLDPILLRVYLVMASYGGRNGVCTASRETIAEGSGCSAAAAKRAIAKLEQGRWISVERRAGRASVARVVPPKNLDLERSDVTRDTEVGSHRPGVGSHRPDGRVSQTPEGYVLKEIHEGDVQSPPLHSGRVTESQLRFLDDLSTMLAATGMDAEEIDDQIDAVKTQAEADELIKYLWGYIEAEGRENVIDMVNEAMDRGTLGSLSTKALAWVRREGGWGPA